MIHRINVFLICLYLSIYPTLIYSATTPSPSGGGGWTNKTVTRVALSDVIEATARQQVIRNGTAVTLEAVVQETINRRAVGQVLLKRLFAGGLLISATQSLVEGVGWVMEDGAYVKHVLDDDQSQNYCQYGWSTQGKFACDPLKSALLGSKSNEFICGSTSQCSVTKSPNNQSTDEYFYFCAHKDNKLVGCSFVAQLVANPKYDPSANPSTKTIVLTPDLLGDLAVGDYTDPVDESKNKKDKVWTDVENSYKPDVVGNDLSDKVDRKLDNAPETNNKPSNKPKPDGDGQKYPAPDQKPGGQGETENKTDPDTGTQTGTFTLPDWCIWAADQCQWHKEDKKHQAEETTFWGDVKKFFKDVLGFFDWFKKEDDLPEKDDDDQQEDQIALQKVEINWGAQCPQSEKFNYELQGQSIEISIINFEYICPFAPVIKPVVIFGASLEAIFILAGIRRNGGDDE
ncbi:virulence factor TspB C-terminal domain-related protein [Acinetobacter bereziniae]|uniref:virulence factor TspB C-terminal domain-related protein n=1 Tax=Acinetobacter bereziniae TaxID=106648 RepID=UPI0013CECCB1|nr:virulence factor TspB C-terminal domain-related protein [Acinetobacter bereziniae]